MVDHDTGAVRVDMLIYKDQDLEKYSLNYVKDENHMVFCYGKQHPIADKMKEKHEEFLPVHAACLPGG
jgi:hypothetical protein